MPFTQTPGTISDVDIVLSVTQSTLNNQLENLYFAPDSNDPEKYLIDHQIQIGYLPSPDPFNPGETLPGDAGLTAWIGPPRFDLNNIGQDAPPYKTVRVVFPLKAGWLDAYAGGRLGKVLFANWEISWEARFAGVDVQNLEEDILSPATRDTIKSIIGVNEEDFLVSSVFCVFEETSIANSFQLTPAAGTTGQEDPLPAILAAMQDPDDPLEWQTKKGPNGTTVPVGIPVAQLGSNVNILADFKDNIISYYVGSGNDKTKPANPFLLGYTITQHTATKTDQNPILIPKRFVLTTSPSNSQTVDATVNFAMFDFSHTDAEINAIISDANNQDGVITNPLTSVTKSGPATDGIMAFSRNTFTREYIVKELVSRFETHPISFTDLAVTIDSTTETFPQSSLSSYSKEVAFHYPAQIIDDILWWRSLQTSGTNSIQAVWNSTLTNDTSNPFTDDSKRELTIHINGAIHLNLHTQTGVKGPAGPVDGSGPWNDGGNGWADVSWNATLVLTTGSNGSWNFVPDQAHQVIDLPKKDGDGNVEYTWDHHYTGWNVVIQWLQDLINKPLNGIAGQILDLEVSPGWQSGISAAMSSLTSKVVMPAGDVFEFAGLDTDTTGNVYSHVTYKTILSGERNDIRKSTK